MNRIIHVYTTPHKCGFDIYRKPYADDRYDWESDYYFLSREDAEEFIKELQKSVERVWPCDGY